jgi:hypothetical protein
MNGTSDRSRRTAFGIMAMLSAFGAAVAVAALWLGDRPGFLAALGFAAAFSLPSAILGWVLARRPVDGPAQAVAGPLAAVVVRILPPLAALGFLATQRGGGIRAAGAGPMIVGFYLVLLVTDILLHMIFARTHTSRR